MEERERVGKRRDTIGYDFERKFSFAEKATYIFIRIYIRLKEINGKPRCTVKCVFEGCRCLGW